MASPQHITTRLATSEARFVTYPTPGAGAPNVVMVVLDDVGFGAPETFGGPIPTPALDRVATAGLRYNQFHTTALCSPTRAALITGRNHHSAGFGVISEQSTGFPGYNSIIGKDKATIGRMLLDNGYATSWFGKDHNTPAFAASQVGPFDQWPTGMGFEYFYGFVGGDANQWQPNLFRNTTQIYPFLGKPPGTWNLVTAMADDAIHSRAGRAAHSARARHPRSNGRVAGRRDRDQAAHTGSAAASEKAGGPHGRRAECDSRRARCGSGRPAARRPGRRYRWAWVSS